MKSVKLDGQTVSIDDYVCFKSDHEQTGRLVKISRGNYGINLTLEAIDASGFSGDYIKGQQRTIVDAGRCWVE